MHVLTVVALALAAASPSQSASGCSARTVTISFDPRGKVAVVGDGRLLASATYARRSAVAGCAQIVTVSPPRTPKPLYRRATVSCRVKRRLEIEAHAIVPSGSQVIVAERGSDTWLVSAVLKPGGSRVYVFSDSCKIG